MNYVDGFVTPVPKANRDAYEKHAREMAPLLKEFGALGIVECWGDDVPEGKLTSFPMAVQRKEDEVVVFSWISWASKEARDEGWAKLMKDPRMQSAGTPPFDGKRMIYGGFRKILEL